MTYVGQRNWWSNNLEDFDFNKYMLSLFVKEWVNSETIAHSWALAFAVWQTGFLSATLPGEITSDAFSDAFSITQWWWCVEIDSLQLTCVWNGILIYSYHLRRHHTLFPVMCILLVTSNWYGDIAQLPKANCPTSHRQLIGSDVQTCNFIYCLLPYSRCWEFCIKLIIWHAIASSLCKIHSSFINSSF